MCKKTIYLLSFVLLLGSVSSAADIAWTDLGADHLWSNPDNWDLGRVPTLADEVLIDVPAAAAPNGPVIQDGIAAEAKGIWTEAPGEPTLTITGGSLAVADWIWCGDGADSFAVWTISGGTVDVANEFELGWGGGAGTLTVTGGTINAGKAVIPTGSGVFGELFLQGGTYSVTKADGLKVNANGLIDITEGTLVLEGDDTTKINDLIAAGQITAYGSDGQLELDFDGRNPGKTTLTAVGPAPTAPAEQQTITIDNPGFEDPVLAEDDWTWVDVPGWTQVGGDAPGVWNVTINDFDPVIAPEGQNILYTENAPASVANGVAQVLTETFAADTDYTLTADVGNSWNYYFAGYSVQLLAGGTVIAEDNDTLWPDYMLWATSTVQYTYDSADSGLVGQPLEIRLLNLGLDKDSPPGNTVGVEFDNVTLSYDAGAEPGVTIPVDPNSDLAAANALANPGDTIEFAEGTYYITSQIEIKDGVTYRGAGPGLTIIDGNDVTRAFVAWGDRGATSGQVDANGVGVPNATGPKDWVLDGITIQNCVADTVDRRDILGDARDLLNNYTGAPYTLATAQAENAGITDNPGWFDILSGGADDNLTDVELQAYLDGNPVGSAGHMVTGGDKNRDGGAITIHNESVGTIVNCDFLANHTPAGGGDDGGAVNVTGRSTITIDDCWFDGNYAVSPDSVAVDGSDGDGGHIKAQGNNLAGGFIEVGTTLIVNRCTFLNGNAEDDGGAIQATADGIVVRLDSCWFEGNTAWDNGSVLQFPDEDQNEATITNCVFANNITNADNSPDRMCEVRRNTKFVNCTFVGNVQEDQDLIYNNANNADGDDDGTDDELADATQVVNCIFLNNVVGNGDDVLGSRNASFTIAATNCIFFGNTLINGNAADNTQRPDDEVGSILADPLLDALLYFPGVGSPAIDAGTDVGAPDHDYDGAARPQGAAPDVGAYEAPAN